MGFRGLMWTIVLALVAVGLAGCEKGYDGEGTSREDAEPRDAEALLSVLEEVEVQLQDLRDAASVAGATGSDFQQTVQDYESRIAEIRSKLQGMEGKPAEETSEERAQIEAQISELQSEIEASMEDLG